VEGSALTLWSEKSWRIGGAAKLTPRPDGGGIAVESAKGRAGKVRLRGDAGERHHGLWTAEKKDQSQSNEPAEKEALCQKEKAGHDRKRFGRDMKVTCGEKGGDGVTFQPRGRASYNSWGGGRRNFVRGELSRRILPIGGLLFFKKNFRKGTLPRLKKKKSALRMRKNFYKKQGGRRNRSSETKTTRIRSQKKGVAISRRQSCPGERMEKRTGSKRASHTAKVLKKVPRGGFQKKI